MRMQVAQYIAERRKLGDGVIQALPVLQGVDDPAGTPPPPGLVGKDAARALSRPQILDADPLPESAAAPAHGPGEFQRPDQVAGQQQEQRRRHAAADGRPHPAARQPHQVIQQPEKPRPGQRRHRGDGQIVAHRRGDAAQLADERHHQIAEIVVADRVARQPGVFRRKERRLPHRVQEHQVHRFLGVVDGRGRRGDPGPQQKQGDEHQFGGGENPPVGPQKGRQFGGGAPQQPQPGRPAQQQQDPDSRPVVGGDLQRRQQPEGVGKDDQRGRLGQRESPVGQAAEQRKDHRQRQQPQKLNGQKPGQQCAHGSSCAAGGRWGSVGQEWRKFRGFYS